MGKLLFVLAYIGIIVAGTVGYVMNIIKLMDHIHDPSITTEVIIRIIGIVTGLGAIMGYF